MKEMMGDHLPSSRLARLIEKCMSIDPDKRYQSASSLLRALNSLYPAAILPEEASGRIPVRSWAYNLASLYKKKLYLLLL